VCPWGGETGWAIPRRRPGVTIELRWYPAHKGVPGNEKADEWPDAHGVEHLRPGQYGDHPGIRQQLPRSLAHLQRPITEAKWQEAKTWAESKAREKIQTQPTQEPHQKSDSGLANANKQLAAKFYQLETGHCLAGRYLAWTEKQAKCWWCPYSTRTLEHFFKYCTLWKRQQKILWEEVRRETGSDKDQDLGPLRR